MSNVYVREFRKMLLIYFLKRYPTPQNVLPETFESREQDKRLVRNFFWNQRKYIFENNEVLGPIVFSNLLNFDSNNVFQSLTSVDIEEVLANFQQNNFDIHPDQMQRIEGYLHYRIVIILDFVLNRKNLLDCQNITGAVAKYQLAYAMMGHLMTATMLFPYGFQGVQNRVVQSIKTNALVNRNIRAFMDISKKLNVDVFKTFIQPQLENIESEATAMISTQVLREFPDPNPHEVEEAIANLDIS